MCDKKMNNFEVCHNKIQYEYSNFRLLWTPVHMGIHVIWTKWPVPNPNIYKQG
jgi:hypothetical protein